MAQTTRKPAAKKVVTRGKTVEEATPVSEWKKPIPALELPSGKAMKLRNASFQTFMKLGMIPNSLLAVVQSSIDKGKEPNLSELTEDPKQLEDMVQMVDDVVCFVSIEPKVHPLPTQSDADKWNLAHPEASVNDPDELRDEALLYVDEVDDEDKMFIFGAVTGDTRDVETFRGQQANGMANL